MKTMQKQAKIIVKNKVCQTIWVSLFNGVTSLVEEGNVVEIIYLDLSRSFGTIRHDIPLKTKQRE